MAQLDAASLGAAARSAGPLGTSTQAVAQLHAASLGAATRRADPPGTPAQPVAQLDAASLDAAARSAGPPGQPAQAVVQVDEATAVADVAAELGARPVSGGAAGGAAPFLTLDVPPRSLDRLQADERVGKVFTRGTTVGLAMETSVPHIGAPQHWSAGFRGAGKVVAVVDTGVDDAFGGQLLGSACFAATEVSLGSFQGHCGPSGDQLRAFDQLCFDVGLCQSGDPFDAEAGRPCGSAASTTRDCWHGTAVSAIIARDAPTPGVAPDAGIYGIRVFNPAGTSADLVDVYAALEHIVHLADRGVEFGSVNLSVATSTLFPGACDSSEALNGAVQAFGYIVGQLAARRIPVVTATGNDGRPDALAFPACLSSAVSVAATDLDDQLAPFSNTSAALDVLAPGLDEASAPTVPLDVTSSPGAPQQWAGTSFAVPHVAGALALVDEEYPHSSVGQRVWLLRTGGVPVALGGGRSGRRIALADAGSVLHGGVLFPEWAPVAGTPRTALGDFDGDGRADVLAHAPGAAPDRISYGRPDWRFDAQPQQVSGTYLPLTGNFRGAAGGPDDILWYAPGGAGDSVWEGSAARRFTSSPLVIDGTFQPHVGDFDGDGWDDVLWYAPGPDRDALWYGAAGGHTSVPVSIRGSYRVAVGDFDGDGRDDVVFHGPGAATDTMWRGTAGRGFSPVPLTIPGSHHPFALDADGDGTDDLFLYAPGNAPDPLWLGDAGGFAPVSLSVQGHYLPLVGDLDGDGRDDIFWYAPGSAGDSIWFGSDTGRFRGRSLGVSGSYLPLVGDADGAAGDDVIWFNPASTATPVWWSHRP